MPRIYKEKAEGYSCVRCLRTLNIGEEYAVTQDGKLCLACLDAKQQAKSGGHGGGAGNQHGRVIRDPRGL
jgi:hypothetical protein